MNPNSTISVVIPAYNAERYLEQTLESVFAQTCLPLEVIVVDDGSTDGTAEIAARYPVRLIHQQNGGICSARNAGVRASAGTWVAFLDSDDIWFPDKLEEQTKFLQMYPEVGLVVSDLAMFGFWTTASIHNAEADSRKYLREPQTSVYSILRSVPGQALTWRFVFLPSTWLFRKDVLEDIGMFTDGLVGGEDWQTFYRTLNKFPIGVIERPLVNYRVRIDSQSRTPLPTARGKVQALTGMVAHPEQYPEGMAEVARRLLPGAIAERGYAEYHAGMSRQSRASFAQSLQLSFQWGVLIRWLLAWLPLAVYRSASVAFHGIRSRLRPCRRRAVRHGR